MTSSLAAAAALTLVAGVVAVSGPANARSRHRHHHVVVPAGNYAPEQEAYAPVRRAPIPYGYSYYPEEIEGGVSGNLPFNNQIRKFKDPLNANGGGG